ncbi:MAG: sigma 54-interacting transcriptional regulator [Nannocystaceae bacterium]
MQGVPADGSAGLERWLRTLDPAQAFQMLADIFPDAIVFAVDRDKNIVLWSRGAESLLGFRPDEVIGSHCLKANRCQNCLVGCGIEESGEVRDAPLTLFCKDGTSIRVRKTARAFYDSDHRMIGGVEVLVLDRAAAPAARSGQHRPGAVTFHGVTTRAPAMLEAFQICRNVAETDANALIQGESGTGKELMARALHAESARRNGPFLAVNCVSLTPALMDSELFGHVRGAFVGAATNRDGIVQQADGGTLFLDEIVELPLDLQEKLLRVLEERCVAPLGSGEPVSVDVRIVAATQRALSVEVTAGRFRADLLACLRVVPITLPALRERRGDVEVLLWRFIAACNASGGRCVDTISPTAMRVLLDHDWPGNVRELKNVVEYAFAVGRGPQLGVDELPPEFRHAAPLDERPLGRRPVLGPEEEAARIREALRQCNGHLGRAAERLGVSRPTLWRKRKKYGI